MYFGLNCALGSLSAFLPTIIETMGHCMFVPAYLGEKYLTSFTVLSTCTVAVNDCPSLCGRCSDLDDRFVYF